MRDARGWLLSSCVVACPLFGSLLARGHQSMLLIGIQLGERRLDLLGDFSWGFIETWFGHFKKFTLI